MDPHHYEHQEERLEDIAGDRHPYFRWTFLVALLAIIGAGIWFMQESSSDRMLPAAGANASLPVLRQPVTDSQASAAAEIAGPRPLGTSGQAEATAEGGIDSPAVIREIETITGTNDGHELVGRKVSLHVPVQGKANDVAFWVGEKDNRILVVMERDRRNDKQRQDGEIAAHAIAPVHAGQAADITGTIEKAPNEEGRYSWNLTNEDRHELAERPIYIRADSVTTGG